MGKILGTNNAIAKTGDAKYNVHTEQFLKHVMYFNPITYMTHKCLYFITNCLIIRQRISFSNFSPQFQQQVRDTEFSRLNNILYTTFT